MGSILVAMPKREDSKIIADMIRSSGVAHEVIVCGFASEVLQKANDRDYGVVICTTTVRGMGCVELFDCLPTTFHMLLLTKNEALRLSADRAHIMLLPIKRRNLLIAIEQILSTYKVEKKKRTFKPPKRNPQDQKIIDEAKHILMEDKGMTEPEAFRYIQKNSMDSGRSLLESAQMILLLYND